jgi:N-acetylglutamate synthase-like GNAT family acetyltransferase
MGFKTSFLTGIIFLACIVGLLAYFYLPRPPSDLKIVYLSDRPEFIPALTDWTYNKWKDYDPTLTKERASQIYKRPMSKDTPSFVLLMLNKDKLLGMISLHEHEVIDDFKDKSPWIDDFYVDPKYINEKISVRRYLMRSLQGASKNIGINKLYVFTSDPAQVDWYMELGWKIIKTSMYQNHLITIMELDN